MQPSETSAAARADRDSQSRKRRIDENASDDDNDSEVLAMEGVRNAVHHIYDKMFRSLDPKMTDNHKQFYAEALLSKKLMMDGVQRHYLHFCNTGTFEKSLSFF